MLTSNQISSYKENGYLIVEKFFDMVEIGRIDQAIEEILASEGGRNAYESEPEDKNVIRRIWSPTKKHHSFEEMAASDKLLDCIEGLIGPNIVFHYSKFNMKGPRVGSVIEWHQDFSYYPHTNSDMLSAVIFLDDADRNNGCLRVIPRSHKVGLCDHREGGYFRGKVSGIDENEAVAIEAPAGSIVFLHCLTLHASTANKSDRPRRAFLPAYRSSDAFPIYFGPHAIHNEPGVKVLRGRRSFTARSIPGNFLLPIAETEFGSIYDVQEGAHLTKSREEMKSRGYAVE